VCACLRRTVASIRTRVHQVNTDGSFHLRRRSSVWSDRSAPAWRAMDSCAMLAIR
jgi:hypothetical protein